MSKNIVDKIWESHIVKSVEGHPTILFIDLMLLHEVTSAQAFDMLRAKQLKPLNSTRLFATIDHSIPTRSNRLEIYDETAKIQVNKLRENAKEYGINFYDFDSGYQGVVHVIGPELGLTQPGMTIVCGDSHTSTHGAFGALAFGIGTSEVGHVLATSCLLQLKPKTMRVEFKGSFKKGVYAKDAILKLISMIGVGGANGHVIEYCGDAVRQMDMSERMTVCNMSIECGARAGLISPNETTFNYIKGRKHAPDQASWDNAIKYWSSFASDKDAKYDKEIVIDVSNLDPMVTWGTNPSQGCEITEVLPTISSFAASEQQTAQKALEYVRLQEGQRIVPIDWAFIGSCTNGRIEDLRIAAEILKGKKISSNVTMYVVPGSEAVREQAIAEGLDKVFEDAGVQFRMPGCSMCLGMNDDKVPHGSRCISSSNRNFVGRQGPGSITHLASPATVAASAVAGKVSSAENFLN